MKKIVVFIICLAALYHFKPELFPGFSGGAYDADGNPQVIIFTFDDCGAPCADALSVLRQKKVSFEEVNLTNNSEGESRFRKMGSGNALPVTFIGAVRVEGFQRERLTEALSGAYGFEMLDGPTRGVIQTHFNADGSPKVVMYGASWCGYCKQAREFFQDEGIAFTEWDVEQDSAAKARFDLIRSSGYPLIYVGSKRFEGFDQRRIMQALNADQ